MSNCIVVSINDISRRLKYNLYIMKRTYTYITYKFLCTKPRRTICLYIHGKLCKILNIHTLWKVFLQNCYFHQHTSCLCRCMIWIMIYCIWHDFQVLQFKDYRIDTCPGIDLVDAICMLYAKMSNCIVISINYLNSMDFSKFHFKIMKQCKQKLNFNSNPM